MNFPGIFSFNRSHLPAAMHSAVSPNSVCKIPELFYNKQPDIYRIFSHPLQEIPQKSLSDLYSAVAFDIHKNKSAQERYQEIFKKSFQFPSDAVLYATGSKFSKISAESIRGFCISERPKNQTCEVLHTVGVNVLDRREGVATKLIALHLEEAKKRGSTSMLAAISLDSNATLLERLGFKHVCDHKYVAQAHKIHTLFLREYLRKHATQKMTGLPEDLDTTFLPILAHSNEELAAILKQRNIKLEKGILLYGPPGTGKTSLAREVGGFLGIPEERTHHLSCSELLVCASGDTEKKIRALFEPAIKEQENAMKKGYPASRFLIVFDELDTLALDRNSSTTDWYTSHVNQMLTSIDGLKKLDNVVVIGIVNNKDRLDPALIRPGRLGVHICLGLPTRQERKEIVEFYMEPLLEQGVMAKDAIDKRALLDATEGLSGAEIGAVFNRVNQKTVFDALKGCSAESGQLDDVVEKFKAYKIRCITQADLLAEIMRMHEQKTRKTLRGGSV